MTARIDVMNMRVFPCLGHLLCLRTASEWTGGDTVLLAEWMAMAGLSMVQWEAFMMFTSTTTWST
jgi:hypothetical protein